MSYNLLKGKRGIIFGALNDMSIAWKVAEKAVEEGAVITLSNTPVAVRMGDVSKLGEKLNAEVIPGRCHQCRRSRNGIYQIYGDSRRQDRLCTSLNRHVA